MSNVAKSAPTIRTAVAADLPELQRVYRSASLSNDGEGPRLLARTDYLVFAGAGIAGSRTRVAVSVRRSEGAILGFATVAEGLDGALELDDPFVDPLWQRHGIARRLVVDAARSAHAAGHRRLSVTANPHASAFYSAAGFLRGDRVTTPLGDGRRMRLAVT